DLPGLQDIAALVAEGDRELPCVLIDPQVQHPLVLLWVVGWKVSYLTLPTRGRTASAQRGHSFIVTQHAGPFGLRAHVDQTGARKRSRDHIVCAGLRRPGDMLRRLMSSCP